MDTYSQTVLAGLHRWASEHAGRRAAVLLVGNTGLLDTYLRVDRHRSERFIGSHEELFWLNDTVLAQGDATFSTSEIEFSKIAASFMGVSVPLDLEYIAGRSDAWHKNALRLSLMELLS